MTGEEVICPWHGSRFNVKTGLVMTPPAREGVKSFAVRVAGDDVNRLAERHFITVNP